MMVLVLLLPRRLVMVGQKIAVGVVLRLMVEINPGTGHLLLLFRLRISKIKG